MGFGRLLSSGEIKFEKKEIKIYFDCLESTLQFTK